MSHTGDYIAAGREAAEGRDAGRRRPARTARRTRTRRPPPCRPRRCVEAAPRPLDWHGTRRAPRYRVRQGVEIQVDGNPASVVDLSVVGVQVLSATILRPNQKVRISIPNDEFVMRFRGAIAWAKFELPKPTDAPRYRAGVEFVDADARPSTSRSSSSCRLESGSNAAQR